MLLLVPSTARPSSVSSSIPMCILRQSRRLEQTSPALFCASKNPLKTSADVEGLWLLSLESSPKSFAWCVTLICQ